jgi:hypothetical protein
MSCAPPLTPLVAVVEELAANDTDRGIVQSLVDLSSSNLVRKYSTIQEPGSKSNEPNLQRNSTGARSVMKKEVFVCDTCGTRMRLNSAERHWCELCTLGSPLEMRPARDKRLFNSNRLAPLVLPTPVRSLPPQPRVLFGLQSTQVG